MVAPYLVAYRACEKLVAIRIMVEIVYVVFYYAVQDVIIDAWVHITFSLDRDYPTDDDWWP